jgi:transcriptional regulator with XRE-family HTH domain
MTGMTDPTSPSGIFSERLSAERKRKGWTQRELGERMREIGSRIDRSVLAKIEAGGRNVTVDEVIAFAYALGVPPISLLLPLDNRGEVKLAGDVSVPVGRARAWWREADPLTDDWEARSFFYGATDQLLAGIGRRLVEALVIYRLATDLVSEGVDDLQQVESYLRSIEANAQAGRDRLKGKRPEGEVFLEAKRRQEATDPDVPLPKLMDQIYREDRGDRSN